jgi:acylphosphatase
VQGVWYRGSTERQAKQLDITGYAKNLDDGRVEVLACGKEEQLNQLCKWCWEGPELARVTEVNCENIQLNTIKIPVSFTIC